MNIVWGSNDSDSDRWLSVVSCDCHVDGNVRVVVMILVVRWSVLLTVLTAVDVKWMMLGVVLVWLQGRPTYLIHSGPILSLRLYCSVSLPPVWWRSHHCTVVQFSVCSHANTTFLVCEWSGLHLFVFRLLSLGLTSPSRTKNRLVNIPLPVSVWFLSVIRLRWGYGFGVRCLQEVVIHFVTLPTQCDRDIHHTCDCVDSLTLLVSVRVHLYQFFPCELGWNVHEEVSPAMDDIVVSRS